MIPINPNGPGLKPDFSKATRFEKANHRSIDTKRVIATDADGLKYIFNNVEEAAKNLRACGFVEDKITDRYLRANLFRACRGKTSKNAHRAYGFDWKFLD